MSDNEKKNKKRIESTDIQEIKERISKNYKIKKKPLLRKGDFGTTRDYFDYVDSYNLEVPTIDSLAKLIPGPIDSELYEQHKVNRGLRDENGKAILTGLTRVSEIVSYEEDEEGNRIGIPGKLYYRGYNVEDLIEGFIKDDRLGFEEVAFLLLFGKLPTEEELKDFSELLVAYREIPIEGFVRGNILTVPSVDIMNNLSRCVLSLFFYDEAASDTSIENVLRQSLELIALFPRLCVYSYQAYNHYRKGGSLVIHEPDENKSIAETILQMLRPDEQYSPLEARVLDICLILHAEHGGGNNSTFTTHVVTSSGTDTYSSVAASLGSLKGPRHGGANIKVIEMFEDIKANVSDWEDEEEVRAYLEKILNKEAFDGKGLIYGMGHAIYSVSDPRAEILKKFVKPLAEMKGLQKEFKLYENVEKIAPEVLKKHGRVVREVSANIDFYSGFVYYMLGLPVELYTPLFAIARIVGWSAHRLEELMNSGKIIRPAYMNVQEHNVYQPLSERNDSEEVDDD